MKSKLILLLAAILLLCGCERIVLVQGHTSAEETTAPTTTTPPQTEPEISPYPITVNGTEISASPQKIVSLTPALTEICFELGYGDRIIGVCKYCDSPEAVKQLPTIDSGASPDIDAIVKLGADMVITATPIVQKSVMELEDKGITLVTLPAPVSLKQLEFNYNILGAIFAGNIDGGDTGKAAFNTISDAAKKAKSDKKIKFIYITAALSPAGGNTLESDVLSLFGENCAKEGNGYDYDITKLAENQPDYIFLNSEFSVEQLSEHEVYKTLTAVQQGKVITLDNRYFERPSAKLAELINTVADSLKQTSDE